MFWRMQESMVVALFILMYKLTLKKIESLYAKYYCLIPFKNLCRNYFPYCSNTLSQPKVERILTEKIFSSLYGYLLKKLSPFHNSECTKLVNRNVNHWAVSHVNVKKGSKKDIMKMTRVTSTEKKKKKAQPKVESYVLFSGQNWGLKPETQHLR